MYFFFLKILALYCNFCQSLNYIFLKSSITIFVLFGIFTARIIIFLKFPMYLRNVSCCLHAHISFALKNQDTKKLSVLRLNLNVQIKSRTLILAMKTEYKLVAIQFVKQIQLGDFKASGSKTF